MPRVAWTGAVTPMPGRVSHISAVRALPVHVDETGLVQPAPAA
jgi:hypothetical protein